VDVDSFKILPESLQLEYINTWYEDVNSELLSFAINKYSVLDVFEFSEKNWQSVREEMEGDNQ